MPSKNSSDNHLFSFALWRRSSRKVWPLWLVFFIALLFLVPFSLFAQTSAIAEDKDQVLFFAKEFFYSTTISSLACFILLAAGFFCALSQFSYLLGSTSSVAVHALPLKKKTLFFTNYLSGLFPPLAAETLCCLLCVPYLLLKGLAGSLPALFTMLLVLLVMTLLFYSLAVLGILLSGNIGMAAFFYLLFHFFAEAVHILLITFAGFFLYGFSGSAASFLTVFSPAAEMLEWVPYIEDYDHRAFSFHGFPLMAAYFIAGLALFLVSMVLACYRKNEMAGAALGFPCLKPVFKYGASFALALLGGAFLINLVFSAYPSSYVPKTPCSVLICLALVLLPGIAGYYAAEMVLQKSVRVFGYNAKRILPVCLVLAVGVLMAQLDVFHYSSRIPNAASISSVDFSIASPVSVEATITDSREIQLLRSLQDSIMEDRAAQGALQKQMVHDSSGNPPYTTCTASFTYNLKNGTTVRRSYDLYYVDSSYESGSKSEKALVDTLSDENLAHTLYFGNLSADDLEAVDYYYKESGDASGSYQDYSLNTPSQKKGFYEALEKDIQDGALPGMVLQGVSYIDANGETISPLEEQGTGSSDSSGGAASPSYQYLSIYWDSKDTRNDTVSLTGAMKYTSQFLNSRE